MTKRYKPMRFHGARDAANASQRPEWSGDGSAKKLEEERARKMYTKQAEAAKKGFREAVAEPVKVEPEIQQPRKQHRIRGKSLDPRVAKSILEKVSKLGFDGAVADLSDCLKAKCQVDPRDLGVRGQLQFFLEDNQYRFMASWRTYFGIWAGALGNVTEVPTMPPIEVQTPSAAPESGVFEAQSNVEHQPRPPSSEETGIVKTVTVDGWSIDFRLPMLTRDGAEQARITLTELAKRLGYSDKSKLKQLAERHASELAEFGISATVAVMSQRGNGAVVQLQEPTYNPDQAAYLALSSETEAGRACRVRILKAYKALLGLFEEVAAKSQAIEPIDGMMRQLLANQTQMMGQILQSQNNLTALVAAQIASPRRERRSRDIPEQQMIPQAEPISPRSEIVRLAEQDQTTNRKVLSAMIKRLAGVHKGMPTVEYGARMSVAYHQIEDELPRFGHNMSADMKSEYLAGRRANSLEYFESKGIVRLVMKIVEELYEAKMSAKRDEKGNE